MELFQFLIVLSFISYSLTISINKIYHLEKYTKFEYDTSSPSFTIIDPANFKDTNYIYLIFKSNDDSILDKDLSIYYFEKNLDLNLDFEPSKVIKGESETKKEKEKEIDYIYQISFLIQKDDRKLIIVRNLVSDGDMMELENKIYVPSMNKVRIIIVSTILFEVFLVGLIILNKIRGERARINTNKKSGRIMKNQNREMDYQDNNGVVIKPMRNTNQKPASSNDSTEDDNDNNELDAIN